MTGHVVVEVLLQLEDGVTALHRRTQPDARLAVHLQVCSVALEPRNLVLVQDHGLRASLFLCLLRIAAAGFLTKFKQT